MPTLQLTSELAFDHAATARSWGENREGNPSVAMADEPRSPANISPNTTGRRGGRRNTVAPSLPNRTGSSRNSLVSHASAKEVTKGIAIPIVDDSGLSILKRTIAGQCHRYSG